ncbi:MAG: AEC family transporter [Lachnospiraceae bacterium]
MVNLVVKQVMVMFLLMMVGFVLYKKKKITNEGSRTLASLLIYVVLPCVIVNSFCMEKTDVRVKGLIISTILALLCLIISIVLSKLIFNDKPIDIFASSFSNPGFFGIPLILAVLGQEAVFYIATFIAFLNIAQWTYGVALLKGEKPKVSLKQIFLSPFMIGLLFGITIFFVQIPVPEIIKSVLTNICNANTAIAMLLMGVYIAQADIKSAVKNPAMYLVTLARLIFIPAVCMALLYVIPGISADIKISLIIAAACPVGANVAVYAQLYQKDYVYAVLTVAVSTIFSIITLPLIVTFGYICYN